MTVQEWVEMGARYVDYYIPKEQQLTASFVDYHDGVHAYTGMLFSDREEQCVLAWVEGLCGGPCPVNEEQAEYWYKGEEASYVLPVKLVAWIRSSAS